jgi:hypothetical protein
MQRLKLLVLALMAVFALGAVASTAASAEVILLTSPGGVKTNNETFGGTSVKTTGLGVLGNQDLVLCTEQKNEGKQEGETALGTFHIDFKKCTTNLGGTCTGLGEGAGEILLLGKYHLVFDKLGTGTGLGAGILFLIPSANTVHFACTVLFVTKLYLVLGEVLCLITPINMAANKKFTVKCERGAEDGDPGETVYWNEAGTQVNMGTEGLLTKEDPGTYQMSSEEGEGTFETTQNVELMA